MSDLVKVDCLRSFRSGQYRGIKGQPIELPAALAATLAAGQAPAVRMPAAKGK